ncbi:hypothetical protein [Clostridium botulinum]|uniref:hypothetical protein n=1 Tax=Clostridium botulinum TaxID=1491 RepID=UPI001E4703F0|nr:hypothetical protein [Clostridium botulinum]MCD3223832.1 hypothetical protein [Clostridium botulinum C/D]MCD3295268.1 hypothetical protein [Clostridium botulinum C/D]
MLKWSNDLTDCLPESSFYAPRNHSGRFDYIAYRAFNNHPEDSNFWDDCEGYEVTNPNENDFIKIDFLKSVAPSRISIQGLPDNYLPRKIELLGSNDDKTYFHIDYIDNIIGDAKVHYYEFNKKGSFRFIKIKFIEYDTSWICINQIEFFENLNKRKYIIKQNDKYYSINQKLYNLENNSFLEIEKDFDRFGFDLKDLIKTIDKISYVCSKTNHILKNEILGFDNDCKFLLSKNNEIYTINAKTKIINDLGTCSSIGTLASNINAIFNPDTKLNNTWYWDDGSASREGVSIEFNEAVIITRIELYGSDRYPLGNVNFELDNKKIYFQEKVSESEPMIFEGFVSGRKLDIVRYLVKDSVIQKVVVYGIKLKDICVKKGNTYINGNYVPFLNVLKNKTDYKLIIDNNYLPVNLVYKLEKPFRPIDKFSGKIELIRQTEK